MLNDIWSNLVNKVKAAKKRHKELESAMTITNDCLNDGISALDVRLDRLEDRFRVIRNVQDDVRTTVNKQQRQIFDMGSRISFYSRSIVQLEGKKVEEVKARFDGWNNVSLVRMTRSKSFSTVLLPPRRVVVVAERALLR